MNILEKYNSAAKTTSTQVGKSASLSKSSYQKALSKNSNLGKLISTVSGEQPLSLSHNDFRDARKFNSKFDLSKTPTKYTDTIK